MRLIGLLLTLSLTLASLVAEGQQARSSVIGFLGIASANDQSPLHAAFYTTGMEHSPTSATGTGWERTPWHATQRAAWGGVEVGLRPRG
jgi:hypothetical protein